MCGVYGHLTRARSYFVFVLVGLHTYNSVLFELYNYCFPFVLLVYSEFSHTFFLLLHSPSLVSSYKISIEDSLLKTFQLDFYASRHYYFLS